MWGVLRPGEGVGTAAQAVLTAASADDHKARSRGLVATLRAWGPDRLARQSGSPVRPAPHRECGSPVGYIEFLLCRR